MQTFADRLIKAIEQKGNPCVVGLDPRIDQMPEFVLDGQTRTDNDALIHHAIVSFHTYVLDVIASMAPAVKLQIAFYEQYGLPGLQAFRDTIEAARARGLVIIVDAKRCDISSTAEAYANAFLGEVRLFGSSWPGFNVDCLTVTPFL